MDAARIDALLVAFAAAPSRRAAFRSVLGLGLASLAGPVGARRKHKRKKKKKCAKAGQRLKRKKRKRCCAGLTPDAQKVCRSRSVCTPRTCPAGACGSLADGCGGALTCGGCPTGQICLRGNTCQPCTITCTGSPTQCGALVHDAVQSGGTYYLCPGRYQGGFVMGNDPVTLIGAGDGNDPASNTVLDGAFAGRVLDIQAGAGPLTLERLRVGAGLAAGGGGIRLQSASLHMTDCTVLGNVSDGGNGGGLLVDAASTLEMVRCTIAVNHAQGGPQHVGGGIWTAGGTTLTDCVVENNTAPGGGGIYVEAGTTALAGSTQVRGNSATTSGVLWGGGGIFVNQVIFPDSNNNAMVTIAETCRVTGNRAAPDEGGGIRGGNNVTLAGADPSPIVVNNCHENCFSGINKCAQVPVSCSA